MSTTDEFYVGTTMGFHVAQCTKVATIQDGDFRFVSIKISTHIFGNIFRSSAFQATENIRSYKTQFRINVQGYVTLFANGEQGVFALFVFFANYDVTRLQAKSIAGVQQLFLCIIFVANNGVAAVIHINSNKFAGKFLCAHNYTSSF